MEATEKEDGAIWAIVNEAVAEVVCDYIGMRRLVRAAALSTDCIVGGVGTPEVSPARVAMLPYSVDAA